MTMAIEDVNNSERVTTIGVGIGRQVDADADELLRISAAIHANPELGFAEHKASALLCDAFDAHGFTVSRGIAGLPTAFRAEQQIGSGDGPSVAVFCEYDALPGLGHGCGHNIIAAAGLGGALSAARLLNTDESIGQGASGRLVAFGSPAEEGGGGKVHLIEHGELQGIDAAVMIHPAGYDAIGRTNLGRISLEARFTGFASHAAAAPEFGRNALDAATLLLVAIGLLRQQLRPDARVHAIVVDGGDSINIIPATSNVKIFIRSADETYLRGRLYEAVHNCVTGAALATGTSGVLDEVAKAYDPVLRNKVLAKLTEHAYAGVGRTLDPAMTQGSAGSTDMGNVSQIMPSVHPYLRVRHGTPLHSVDFVEAAASPDAERAVLDGAQILGTVLATMLCQPALVEAAHAEFKATLTEKPSK